MSRKLKPHIHIFFPEASHRGNKIDLCEHFFIKHSFQRKVTQAKIVSYAEDFEKDFNMEIKSKKKRYSPNPSDLFFIVLDTDITANRTNIDNVISQIQSLNNKYGDDAHIILSGRSFEVWLCMYNRQEYTTPYNSQDELNRDVISSTKYVKKESWYINNADRLYDQYPNAKTASILSKKNVFKTTPTQPPDGIDLVYKIPNLSNIAVIHYLVNTTPFTYIEHLIGTIKQYE